MVTMEEVTGHQPRPYRGGGACCSEVSVVEKIEKFVNPQSFRFITVLL